MSDTTAEIRPTLPEDFAANMAISRAVGVFSAEEVDTVQELIDEFQARGPEVSGYHFLTCTDGARVAGFACYGPRALTDGVYDLFWIATDPAVQGKGIGAALSARCAQEVRARGGRLLIAETSGLPQYIPTRRFYEHHGYTLDATIADFYSPGDNLCIFVLRV